MNEEIAKLVKEYTQETANLKDYQCPLRSAIYGRQLAQRILKKCEKDECEPYYVCDYSSASGIAKENHIEIERGEPYRQEIENGIPCRQDPSDDAYYVWALVPEYNSHNQAKVVLRRIATQDGEILLPQEKRAEKRLKITEKEGRIIKMRSLKAIVDKIKNYEAQIKTQRRRLVEQIRKNDKVYMEAEAIEMKRICDRMQEDLDDFLDLLV